MQERRLAKCLDGCLRGPACQPGFTRRVIDDITDDRQTNDLDKLLN